MEKRLLVTGSRDWTDRDEISVMLYSALQFLGGSATLISGACETGADRIAEDIWENEIGGKVERHPADWTKHGKKAGYIRNKAMVDSGIDLCVAFVKNNSRGASMTVNLATKAHIETWTSRE